MTLDERLSQAARHVADGVTPPEVDFGAVRARARNSQRRTTALAAAAIFAVVAALGATVGGSDDTAPPPIPEPTITEPTITETPTLPGQRFAALAPEEIKSHPDAKVLRGIDDRIEVLGAPGVGARFWEVCLDVCRPGDDTAWFDGTVQWALEVTSDAYETSALYAVPPRSSVSHAADDRFVVTRTAAGVALVDSSGAREELATGATLPVTELAGPLVFTGQPWAWVDLEAGELHGIESAAGIWEWEPAGESWYWGSLYVVRDSGRIAQRALAWRNPDGTFGVRVLTLEPHGYSTQMLHAGRPGTMAVVDPGPPGLLHVSTDYGATWQVRVIPEDVPRHSPGGPVATDGALPDDWETWPIQ